MAFTSRKCNMVIEVDDSGWGDLLGGVVIVMRRVKTNECYSDIVPLEMFQGTEFKYQGYLRITTEIILNGLDQLKASTSEPIHICTGYIFKTAKEVLKDLGYKIKEIKIEGETQTLAENEFIKSLVTMGIGTYQEVKSMRSYNGFNKWVKEDLERREKFVKTGWKSWEKQRKE